MNSFEGLYSGYEKLKLSDDFELTEEEIEEIVYVLEKSIGTIVPTKEGQNQYYNNRDEICILNKSIGNEKEIEYLLAEMKAYDNKYFKEDE